MNILSDFAENLSSILADSSLSVEQFADKVGVDSSDVYRYLGAKRLPCFENIIKIADTFNCSVDWLLGLRQFPENANYKPTPPFCETFKQLLQKYGLSRYRLQKDTHIAANTIDDWYHGRRNITVDSAIKLADYFKCTLDALLQRE